MKDATLFITGYEKLIPSRKFLEFIKGKGYKIEAVKIHGFPYSFLFVIFSRKSLSAVITVDVYNWEYCSHVIDEYRKEVLGNDVEPCLVPYDCCEKIEKFFKDFNENSSVLGRDDICVMRGGL